jgi:hypothetical protein
MPCAQVLRAGIVSESPGKVRPAAGKGSGVRGGQVKETQLFITVPDAALELLQRSLNQTEHDSRSWMHNDGGRGR